MIRGARLLMLGLAGSALTAADLVERTAYLRIEALPQDFAYTIDAPNGEFTGDDSYGRHLALALGGRYSFSAAGSRHGALLGAEVALAEAEIDPDGSRLGVEGRVVAGWGFALSRQWTVLGTLRGSWMLDRIELAGTDAFDTWTARGDGWAVQPEATLAWSPGGRWRFAADLGWRVARNEYEADRVDLELRESGFVASIGFEYLLSAAPRPLE